VADLLDPGSDGAVPSGQDWISEWISQWIS
jgi:hypothetical protein